MTLEDINVFFYDSYFLFFSHNDYLSFIKDYLHYLNSDILSNIFKIIEKLVSYLFTNFKKTKISYTIILDDIKKEMKNDVYELITFCKKLCGNKNNVEPKIKLLFSGSFNFGEIYSEKLTYLINSNSNLEECSKYHVIFDNSYKIPKNSLPPSYQNIIESLNFELSSYHEYYDIIYSINDDNEKLKLIKQKIKNDLLNYDKSYLCLNKLLIEKCKINKESYNEDEIRYLIDINQENNILENLPWSYFKITRNMNNKTGYNIDYKDNICKKAIEEIIDEYYTKINFFEYEKNKPNTIFGYFFEQFLVNNFKNSKRFLNYKIDDILVINSIYTNDNDWEFIKHCEISSNKCYLIIQNLINAPYYDLAVLIPKGENFIIILIQITVKKDKDKREILKVEYNFQRFQKIKSSFENSFKSFKLIDGDFCYIIYEERDKDTIEFCINNCIKCISYYKEDIFKYWQDDLNPIIIDKYPIDEFSILNSINNKRLTLRMNNIKKSKEKILLNLYNINPRTKKIKPIINLSNKEKEIMKNKIEEIMKDDNIFKISFNFIENESDINIDPLENEIIVYLKENKPKMLKIGYEFNVNNEIKYYNFINGNNLNKSDASLCQKYKIIYYNKFIGKKRCNTK